MKTLNMKNCVICLRIKEIECFCKDKSRRDGLNNKCKQCVKESQIKNKEKLRAYKDAYIGKNKEKLSIQARERRRIFRLTQREKYNEQRRVYYINKNKKRDDFLIIFLAKNPIFIDCYYKKEKEKGTVYKIRNNMRSRMGQCIKDKNNKTWQTIVGYSIKKLRNHLEKKFQEGMSWENYGEWHIDHIIPVSKFNIKSIKDEDFKRCWSLKNLQPLWAFDNLKKHNKISKPVQQSFSFM